MMTWAWCFLGAIAGGLFGEYAADLIIWILERRARA